MLDFQSEDQRVIGSSTGLWMHRVVSQTRNLTALYFVSASGGGGGECLGKSPVTSPPDNKPPSDYTPIKL